MAITRPQTDTIISTTGWGIPITDQVNANTTDIANMKPGAWTNLTLQNGWTNWGQGYAISQYRKRGDMVDLRGSLSAPGAEPTIAILPAGFRPPGTIMALMTWFYSGDNSQRISPLVVLTSGSLYPAWPGPAVGAMASFLLSFSITA